MSACKVLLFPPVGHHCRMQWGQLESRRFMTGDTQRTMDLAQQAFQPDSLADLLAASAHGDRQAFAELYRLTHRRLYAIALALLRQRRRRALETCADPLAEEALQIPDPQPAPSVDHLAHAIQECLRRLSADQSQAIALAFFHGLSHEELATRLKTPLGTVKSWVRRGLLQLKGCLES